MRSADVMEVKPVVRQDLVDAVAALWRLPPPGPANLFAAPEFRHLVELCAEQFGCERMFGSAVWNAVRALGAPWRLAAAGAEKGSDPAAIAAALVRGFTARSTLRRHLCPLDFADDLPDMAFGNARVVKPSREQLAHLFDAPRLARVYPAQPLDADRLAKFHWLVIDEEVAIDPRPDRRANPFFYWDMSQDLGAIDPHRSRFPEAVERALFFLVLASWEDWHDRHEPDWRAFRVPWVHSFDQDLAVQPSMPPSADALSIHWETRADRYGGDYEVEVPGEIPLTPPAGAFDQFSEPLWEQMNAALATELFATPVQHFLVHAFLSDGIDEVMAHMVSIEAALGEETDLRRRSERLKPDPAPTFNAKERLGARVAGLLQDGQAGVRYCELFEVRSDFIHGRGGIGTISTQQRVLARRLARRVSAALVVRAGEPITGRSEVLNELLAIGAPLLLQVRGSAVAAAG